MTAKTAEHDTVMGALRSAQDVIEGLLNATQALLTSLTYPDSSLDGFCLVLLVELVNRCRIDVGVDCELEMSG